MQWFKRKKRTRRWEPPQRLPPRKLRRNDAGKKKAERVSDKPHTAGLGNVLEGKAAAKAVPKKKRQRKRPVLGKAYQQIN